MQLVHYRLRQFWRGWQATVDPDQRAQAMALLPQAASLRFQQLPPDAQSHCLRVLCSLQEQGVLSKDLAVAALLHDIGKLAADDAGTPITLWWRGPLVLLECFPWLLTRLAAPDPRTGWRYLLYVHQMHPHIGAQWAKAWGCTPITCWLIEHHQDAIATIPAITVPTAKAKQALALLQWADSKH